MRNRRKGETYVGGVRKEEADLQEEEEGEEKRLRNSWI